MNKKFAQWADSQGLKSEFDATSRLVDGFFVSYYCDAASNNVGRAEIHADPATFCDKEGQKAIKKELKKTGGIVFNSKEGTVLLTIASGFGGPKYDKFTDGVDMLTSSLRQYGFSPAQVCSLCKNAGAEDTFFNGTKFVPAHARCKEEHIETQLGKIERNEESGSMLLGIVGAILGGAIGTIPSIISITFFGYIIGYLMALIPLVSFFGYKLLKGKMNSAAPFLISIISLVCTVFMVMVNIYLEINLELGFAIPIPVFMEFILDPEIFADLAPALVQSVMFCILGIVLVWSYINKSNAKQKAMLEASRNASIR